MPLLLLPLKPPPGPAKPLPGPPPYSLLAPPTIIKSLRVVKTNTPQQYNKKSVKFDQGLDFLKVWQGKSKKTIGKPKEHEEKTLKFKMFRV